MVKKTYNSTKTKKVAQLKSLNCFKNEISMGELGKEKITVFKNPTNIKIPEKPKSEKIAKK